MKNNHLSRAKRILSLVYRRFIFVLGLLFGCVDHSTDPQSVTKEEYFEQMKAILSYATDTGMGPLEQTRAKEIIQMGLVFYEATLDSAEAIVPPQELEQVHNGYKSALQANIDAFQAALLITPEEAAADEYYKYLYTTPDAGYAFGEETDAQCALASAAISNGITDFPSRLACNETPQPGLSVGTVANPVNDVTIVHDSTCNGACPNLQYAITSITASAGSPVSITFDNKNPVPFLFNLAVYRGNAERLSADQLIETTFAGGPKVHKLVLNLAPGTFRPVKLGPENPPAAGAIVFNIISSNKGGPREGQPSFVAERSVKGNIKDRETGPGAGRRECFA